MNKLLNKNSKTKLHKQNLVIVRAGNNSLHMEWLSDDYDDLSFETIISFYEKEAYDAFTPKQGVQALLQTNGGKWDNISKILSRNSWERYEYIWFPDDDVLIDGKAVNEMFKVAKNYKLKLCQPALTTDSYFSFLELVTVKGFKMRYTPFVEVMAPCLHRDVVSEAMDLFSQSPSGLGLDLVWGRLKSSGPFRSAVLDFITMRHTRPVGSVLAKSLAREGRSVNEDFAVLKNFSDYKTGRRISYAAILLDGRRMSGRLKVVFYAARSWYSDRKKFIGEKSVSFSILKVIKRHLIYRLRISPLTRITEMIEECRTNS